MGKIIRYPLRRKEEPNLPILDEDVEFIQLGDDRECFNLGNGNRWEKSLYFFETLEDYD